MLEAIREMHPEALLMDGYDDCIVGVCTQFGRPAVVAYSRDKVIQKLMDDGCGDYHEAEEYFEFNQQGAWLGEHTPVFISTEEYSDSAGR